MHPADRDRAGSGHGARIFRARLEPFAMSMSLLSVAYETGPANGPSRSCCTAFRTTSIPTSTSHRARRPRLPGDRALHAWIRVDALPRWIDAQIGEQAAFGADLKALIDALGIPKAVVAGYDWGGRAACVCAAMWPERLQRARLPERLQHPGHRDSGKPAKVKDEVALWYQWYFQMRSWSGRSYCQSRGYRRNLVAPMVAALEIRPSHARP